MITTPCVLVIVLVVRDWGATWLLALVVLLNGWIMDWIDKLEVTERGLSSTPDGLEYLAVALVKELLSNGPVDDFESDTDTSPIEELIIPLERDNISLDCTEPVIVIEDDWALLDSETLLETTLRFGTDENDCEMDVCELVNGSSAEESKLDLLV